MALLAVFAIRGSDYACRVVARHPPDGGETSTGDANRPRPGGPPSRPPSPCGDAHDHRRKPAQRGTGSSRRDNAPVRAIKGDTSGQGPGDTAAQPPAVIALPTRGRGWHHRTGASIRAARAIGKDRAPRHRRTSSSACFHPGRVDERASRARWDRWRRLIRMLSGGIKGDVSAPQGQLCQPGRRWPGWLVRAAAPC